ncbi:MAG: S8 family serine peptidase [bacterium]|nr:S8 family serine peptidase [bacterium]
MKQKYILVPRKGLKAQDPESMSALTALPPVRSTSAAADASLQLAAAKSVPVRVLDTVAEDGPKLVEIDQETAAQINAPGSNLRAEPIVYYDLPDPQPRFSSLATPAAPIAITVSCLDANSSTPVADADVYAFTDFDTRTGDHGKTDVNGEVSLQLSGNTIERLYAFADDGYWDMLLHTQSLVPSPVVKMQPIDLTFQDSVRRMYGGSSLTDATGVVVGVVDTGVGPHPDLNVVGGRNTVTGEIATDFSDWDKHGTHVAGLVGANGGLRGVAPGVPIKGYRVFGNGVNGASNYAIMKALIFAAADGCDIVNLSLGGGPHNVIMEEAIEDAVTQGMLVVIAAGNDGRKPVNYPAAYASAMPVSAMGVETDLPADVLARESALRPPVSTADPNEFIADFSNVGPQIALTGLGVGVLSTLPGGSYGPMSGTSMAAPVVAGCVASLLSHDTSIHGLPRDKTRATAIRNLVQMNSTTRGFGMSYEGYGLPDPTKV